MKGYREAKGDGRDRKKQQENDPFLLTENGVADRLLVCAEFDSALLAKAQPANNTISRDFHYISLSSYNFTGNSAP